jgi:hypothetical protein
MLARGQFSLDNGPGAVIKIRPVGVRKMEDEAGGAPGHVL